MSTFSRLTWNTPRRALLLCILLLSFAVAACGSSGSATTNGPVNLTFWTWVSGIQTEVNLFEKAYPNIHINVVNAGQGAAQYTKLSTALKAGSGAPDIVQIEFPYLPEFELTGKLVDLSQYGATDVKSDFVPWTWSQVSQGSKVYAIPQDSGPMGLLYRKDILDKYQLPVPQTWDQFAQEAATLHAKDPSAFLTEFSENDPNWFFSLLWQAGSHPFTVNGTNLSIHLDDAAALKVADFWGNLISSKAIQAAPDFTNDWYTGLSNGTYASWPTAAWGPGFLTGVAKSSSGDWQAAEIPQWTAGANVSANWGGSTDAVTTQSAHPKEAAEFAMWLNTNAQSTADFTQISSQSLFPTTNGTLQSATFTDATSAFFGGQQVDKLYAQISQQVDPSFQWSPFTDYVYTQWTDYFGKAINGSISYEQAMHELQSNVVAYAKAQGFTVS